MQRVELEIMEVIFEEAYNTRTHAHTYTYTHTHTHTHTHTPALILYPKIMDTFNGPDLIFLLVSLLGHP